MGGEAESMAPADWVASGWASGWSKGLLLPANLAGTPSPWVMRSRKVKYAGCWGGARLPGHVMLRSPALSWPRGPAEEHTPQGGDVCGGGEEQRAGWSEGGVKLQLVRWRPLGVRRTPCQAGCNPRTLACPLGTPSEHQAG